MQKIFTYRQNENVSLHSLTPHEGEEREEEEESKKEIPMSGYPEKEKQRSITLNSKMPNAFWRTCFHN